MQQRAANVPYYYGLLRQAFDTGLSPIFPMYYNFPQFDNAYLTDAKVCVCVFSDDATHKKVIILFFPVCRARSRNTLWVTM